jgi:hypothetical protein
MRNSKLMYFFAGALVALISSAATHSLDAKASSASRKPLIKGSHVNLSPEDYIEIMQLISEYPRDVDPGSVRDASWMFTHDAHSVISGAPMTKPEDFKNFYGSLVAETGQATKGGNRHFNTSPIIIGLPDGTARGSSYMMGVSIKGAGQKPTIDLMGKYEDLYVKTPDGWKMKERIWRSDSYVGSYQQVAPSPVVADPRTWTTETENVIQQLWAAGNTRDEHGEPRTSAGGPSMKRPASSVPAAPISPGGPRDH